MASKRELHLLSGLQLGYSLPVSAILRGGQRDEKHQYGTSMHGLGIISEGLLMPGDAFQSNGSPRTLYAPCKRRMSWEASLSRLARRGEQ